MIERIAIYDFQKHERKIIRIVPGVNCFLGPTNAGKSAVLRALRWVCLNDTPGGVYIRHGANGAKVNLTVDGRIIGRSKDRSKNLYTLDGAEFKAFGQTVPTEIANILDIGEANFQTQLDLPFWFMDSAGEVAKHLNKIVDLELIDRAESSIASTLRAEKSAVSVAEERLKSAEATTTAFAWVEAAQADFAAIQTIQENIKTDERRITRLAILIEDARSYEKARQDASVMIPAIENLCRAKSELDLLTARINRLEDFITEAKAKEVELCQLQNAAERVIEERKKMLKGRCPICEQPISS